MYIFILFLLATILTIGLQLFIILLLNTSVKEFIKFYLSDTILASYFIFCNILLFCSCLLMLFATYNSFIK